jgi:hypothetical protein
MVAPSQASQKQMATPTAGNTGNSGTRNGRGRSGRL